MDIEIEESEQEADANFLETSLVCNIPEHHKLEDIVHQNREQIANLKCYIHYTEV